MPTTHTAVILPVNERWKVLAACKEETVNLFFPNTGESGRIIDSAHLICRTCPVKFACLEYAIDNNVKGIWGDTSEKERVRIKKARRLAQQPRLDIAIASAM